jgi:hypothetical protein
MFHDPIVAEIHAYRAELAKRFNYDLAALIQHAREQNTKDPTRKVVSRPPRRLAGYVDVNIQAQASKSAP